MRVMIIGAPNGHLATAGKIAVSKGAKLQYAQDIPIALSGLRSGGADMIIIDVTDDIEGLCKQLETERICVPVFASGINPEAEAAAQAIKAGARDFLNLPPDPEVFATILQTASREDRPMIGDSPALTTIRSMALKVAPSQASVLIMGESGTGKEVIARFMHQHSSRVEGPFISVNCAAIPDNLLESELFGHEKGAFTGALARRIGKFEEANGGTLLLDEVGEMEMRLQAKLLRAIQERQIDRLGGREPVDVNIRILATTNRVLEQEVQKGHFREDLYYRLNVVSLHLPPLREREGDVPNLVQHFIKIYSEINGLPERPINKEALDMLIAHPWPGNVRELENTVHRAVVLAQGDEIDAGAIILGGQDDGTKPQIGQTLAQAERNLLVGTLQRSGGDWAQAAQILGITVKALRTKLAAHGEPVDVKPA
ncbi:MAG: sigma-54 dependent transcriptional regulator [Pseudomonadota bacterium]